MKIMKIGAYIAALMVVILGCMVDSENPWTFGIGILICLAYVWAYLLIKEVRDDS